jgi:CPA1 family monovalent cation:H+ antiporter
LAAGFGYINYRLIRLPYIIGLMLLSLVFSGLLILLSRFGLNTVDWARVLIAQIDLNELLMEGLLSFLLFAGSLFTDRDPLMEVKLDILTFSLLGTVLSTILVGLAFFFFSSALGLTIPIAYAFVFGALISPTDPVAVLTTLRQNDIPPKLSARIAGEALFNDGIGIVLFLILSDLAVGGSSMGPGAMVMLFIRETIGGVALGLALGWTGYFLIKSVDRYPLEILLTLAVVTGGYSLAHAVNVSGPLAMVVAGLLIGGRGRRLAMSEKTRENLDRFWELVELFLNAILFTIIGMEILALTWRLTHLYIILGLSAILITLTARFLSVGVLTFFLNVHRKFEPGSVFLMTWSGIRGGISIALALSIPSTSPAAARDPIVIATYFVAVFSILVQGTTVKYFPQKSRS